MAEPVPDKPGFVISPYNGKWIDVIGKSKPGTLMEDPHSKEEKKFFKRAGIPRSRGWITSRCRRTQEAGA